ncbi:MAG: glycosyltransferase [Candidatus Acidiferrales bacterium]
MLIIFYILVMAQIAFGVYSLWDGLSWFRLVRHRLASHAGFYAPTTALVCPCKGNERGLEENLLALTRFDYPNYEIYFTLATSLDPALKVIERVKAASQRPVHIVIAGPPSDTSEKVYNLQRAVEALPADKFEMLVFTDSDVRLPRGWLTKLIAPLQDARIGATTAYRWIIPSGSGMEAMPSCFASAWNAAIATMLGKPSGDFCWGGGTAIRKKTFDDVNVLEAWKGAVSDDFAVTWALEQANMPIVFCPECLAATLHPWTGADLLEFTNRQILITRVYSPKRWQMGAIVHSTYVLTILYAIYVILYSIADVDPWGQLFLLLLAIPLLAAMKGAMRTIAIGEAMPEWRGKLQEWSWVYPVLAPVVPFLFTCNFIMSLVTKSIRWRGIRYELEGPNVTRILKR